MERNYPDFITDDQDKRSWDKLSDEDKKKYLDAVPYIREEYPDAELSVMVIGTILTFGG